MLKAFNDDAGALVSARASSTKRPAHNLHRKLQIVLVTVLLAGCPTGSALADSVAYTYDVLGRVVTATYGNGLIINYSYDAAGNRTQQVVSASYPTLVWTATGSGSCTSNCWGSSSWGP